MATVATVSRYQIRQKLLACKLYCTYLYLICSKSVGSTGTVTTFTGDLTTLPKPPSVPKEGKSELEYGNGSTFASLARRPFLAVTKRRQNWWDAFHSTHHASYCRQSFQSINCTDTFKVMKCANRLDHPRRRALTASIGTYQSSCTVTRKCGWLVQFGDQTKWCLWRGWSVRNCT